MLRNGRIVARIAVLGALALALTASGCGDEAKTPQEQVEQTFDDLRSDFADHDGEGVCGGLSASAQRAVGFLGHNRPTTCERDVRQLFKWIGSDRVKGAPAPEMAKVAIEGSRATVTATLNGSDRGEIPFVEEDGEWKLDNVFSVVAPPPADMR
jgi:hypothetical protein